MRDQNEIDEIRSRHGFLSVEETRALTRRGVLIFDPYSCLVSPAVHLSAGIVIWPGVTLQCSGYGSLSIAEDVVLHSATRIVVTAGQVVLGNKAEIGEEGGFTIKAEHSDTVIDIGSGARLLGGGSLMLGNTIGQGAQVLGPIRMQNCSLGAGGNYLEPDPDRRGGVLKGSGVARGIKVPTGMVIQAFGLFSEAPLRAQSYFHPKSAG